MDICSGKWFLPKCQIQGPKHGDILSMWSHVDIVVQWCVCGWRVLLPCGLYQRTQWCPSSGFTSCLVSSFTFSMDKVWTLHGCLVAAGSLPPSDLWLSIKALKLAFHSFAVYLISREHPQNTGCIIHLWVLCWSPPQTDLALIYLAWTRSFPPMTSNTD